MLHWPMLQVGKFNRMRNLETIPVNIDALFTLKYMNLSGNDFFSLPESIIRLQNLKSLYLTGCTKLRSLPILPRTLGYIKAVDRSLYLGIQDIPLFKGFQRHTSPLRLIKLPGHLLKKLPGHLLSTRKTYQSDTKVHYFFKFKFNYFFVIVIVF